jgi:tetrathionate reductase subunit B
MSEESSKPTRAEFLKSAGRSIVLIGLGAAGYGAFLRVEEQVTKPQAKTHPSGYPRSPWYAMAIDIEKCIGCGKCVDACCMENDVPEHHFRTWIERYVVAKDGTVEITSPEGGRFGFAPTKVPEDDIAKAFFVPKLCNQCDQTPCTQVCPVGATFQTREGVVLVDQDWCIGCRYCIQACPYGSRFFNPKTRTADKCTLCYHRITKGKLPACVEVCPTEARVFGNLADPESPVSKFVRENQVMTLKPHLKTGSKTVYKGLSKEVV